MERGKVGRVEVGVRDRHDPHTLQTKAPPDVGDQRLEGFGPDRHRSGEVGGEGSGLTTSAPSEKISVEEGTMPRPAFRSEGASAAIATGSSASSSLTRSGSSSSADADKSIDDWFSRTSTAAKSR